MKRIYLITGATGHLGNTIVRMLLQQGESIRCLILEDEVPLFLQNLNLEIIHGDVSDKDSLIPFFSNLEGLDVYVLHLAGLISIASNIDDRLFKVNVEGTRNLLELAENYPIKRFVYCSSVHAIPEKKNNAPISEVDQFNPDWVQGAYAKTKAMATQLVLDAGKRGLDVVVVQPSGIIGPNDYEKSNHLNQVLSDYLDHKLKMIVHGGYDFVDVRDVAQGLLAAVEIGKSGECYILSNHYLSITKLINLTSRLSNQKPIKYILTTGFVKLFAPLFEWWAKVKKQRPLFTSYSIYTLNSNSNFLYNKAKRDLNYHPRAIEETLQDTINFIRRSKSPA